MVATVLSKACTIDVTVELQKYDSALKQGNKILESEECGNSKYSLRQVLSTGEPAGVHI